MDTQEEIDLVTIEIHDLGAEMQSRYSQIERLKDEIHELRERWHERSHYLHSLEARFDD